MIFRHDYKQKLSMTKACIFKIYVVVFQLLFFLGGGEAGASSISYNTTLRVHPDIKISFFILLFGSYLKTAK